MSSVTYVLRWRTGTQGRNEVRRDPGQKASLAPPCSNLRSFGTKCIVLKYLWHCWHFSAPAAVIQRPRSDSAPDELCPPDPLVTPLWVLACLQRISANNAFADASHWPGLSPLSLVQFIYFSPMPDSHLRGRSHWSHVCQFLSFAPVVASIDSSIHPRWLSCPLRSNNFFGMIQFKLYVCLNNGLLFYTA